jgi:hypothetical protein
MDTNNKSELKLNRKEIRREEKKVDRLFGRSVRVAEKVDTLKNNQSAQDTQTQFGQEIVVSVFNKSGKLVRETRHNNKE